MPCEYLANISISDLTIVISAHIADTVIHLRCLCDKILKFSGLLLVFMCYTGLHLYENVWEHCGLSYNSQTLTKNRPGSREKTNQTKFSIGLRGERPVLFSVIQIALVTQLQSAYVREIMNHKESFTPALIRFLNQYMSRCCFGQTWCHSKSVLQIYTSLTAPTTNHGHTNILQQSCNMMKYSADQQTRETLKQSNHLKNHQCVQH